MVFPGPALKVRLNNWLMKRAFSWEPSRLFQKNSGSSPFLRSCFESLAVASPRIRHRLGRGNHEVASKKERPESVERVLHKLKQTVEKFEASHPQLTAFVTEYSAVLSGLGI